MSSEIILGNASLLPPLNKNNLSINDIDESSAEETNPAIAYLISLNSSRSATTMRSLLNIIAKLIGFTDLHDCQWEKLRRHHVQGILKLLIDSERAPATINTYLAAIKGVATESWMLKKIDSETYQQIKHVKPVRGTRISRGRALSDFELKKLFACCDNDNTAKGIRDSAILAVLVGCGLRRSEIVALEFKDILWSQQAIIVLGKGNKERMAFMPDGTVSRLTAYVEEIRGDFSGALFSRIRRHDDVTCDKMTDQAVYHILEERRNSAGIEKFSPHDLRRTFASTMLENGEDIITVKDAMGHANIITTQKYDKRGDERLRRASKRFNF